MKNFKCDGMSEVNERPLVSWLLCTHAINPQLGAAIDSCLNQTYQNFELIIVVNGKASKNIVDYLAENYGDDPRVRVFSTEVRYLTFSLNLGLHYARGDFIARMDSDDVSTPDRLEKQINFLLENPLVDVLGTAYQLIDNNNNLLNMISNVSEGGKIRRKLIFGNNICHPSVMFRKKSICAAGGYTGYIHAEDYDLWATLAIYDDYRFHNLEDVCLYYRTEGVGSARRSRFAYATVAGGQFRNFALGYGVMWLVSAFLTFMKGVFMSSARPRRPFENPPLN